MDSERLALCQYRLEKAKEDLEVSKLNYKEEAFEQLSEAEQFINGIEEYLKLK